jgi:SAM-dependent methyltransferase
MTLQEKWDKCYQDRNLMAQAAEVLDNNTFLLPRQGKALDLACGLGGNALLLARHGLETEAWDISDVALMRLMEQSQRLGLQIKPKQVKITPQIMPRQAFDVIVVSRFLDRSLCQPIIAALKPDGLLYYQTFVQDKLTTSGPSNHDYLLRKKELLTLFSSLKLVFYQEFSLIGDLSQANRDEALLIGQKHE